MACWLSQKNSRSKFTTWWMNFLQRDHLLATLVQPRRWKIFAGIRAQMDALKKQEQDIRRGLNIFKIDQPPSKEIANLEKDLEVIETIWNLNKDWEGLWADWKGNKFGEIQTTDMETHSQQIYKKLNRYSKELKDKNWEVVDTSKNKVDQFKRTMPLITDLKNKAMRPRHWEKIQVINKSLYESQLKLE